MKWIAILNSDENIGYYFWSAYLENDDSDIPEQNGLTYSELIKEINDYMVKNYNEHTSWEIEIHG